VASIFFLVPSFVIWIWKQGMYLRYVNDKWNGPVNLCLRWRWESTSRPMALKKLLDY
jgi:hypothetical protein